VALAGDGDEVLEQVGPDAPRAGVVGGVGRRPPGAVDDDEAAGQRAREELDVELVGVRVAPRERGGQAAAELGEHPHEQGRHRGGLRVVRRQRPGEEGHRPHEVGRAQGAGDLVEHGRGGVVHHRQRRRVRGERVDDPAEDVAARGRDDVVERGEVVEHRAARHVRALGERVDRERAPAALAEQLRGGREDRGAVPRLERRATVSHGMTH